MLSILQILWERFLETLFPLSPQVKKITVSSSEQLLKEIPPAENISEKNFIAILSYRHPLTRTAIWEMKYRGHKGITRRMAQITYDYLLAEISDSEIWQNFTDPIIVPIPVSSKRLSERGFNQVERLVKEISKIDNGRNFKIDCKSLQKVINTESQSHTVSRSERLKNLNGCFAIKNNSNLVGRNIILIDDVITTGATMKEAKKVLKEAGAKKIVCLAIAH